MIKLLMFLPLCVLSTSAIAATAPFNHDPAVAEEFRVRAGLPNFFAKLKANAPVRIAYLGGSITAANGWRPKTTAWFKERYPGSVITEINVAISGTGSDYSACRLMKDVMPQKPDLVFLECRVNGGGGYEQKSVEGIVRQIWKTSPRTDICFVYTICEWMLADLKAGKSPAFSKTMEEIANVYGIPTIDVGVEIARREADGSLIFKGNAPVEGKLVFSADGTHPGDAGHDVYRDVIVRCMLKMKYTATAKSHTLPTAMSANCWQTTDLLPIQKAVLSNRWVPVDIATDLVYNDDRGRTEAMLHETVKCSKIGESFTVKWNGTTVGISDIPYGESSILEAVVDNGAPISIERVQYEKIRKYARFWYLPEQPLGDHTVTFTVKKLPEGQSFYAGHLLIVGKLIP